MNNPFEEINSNVLKLTKKVDLILQQLGKVELHDEFNIKGHKAAAEILGDCVSTLQNKIKEGKLIKNKHYRYTKSAKGRKRYFFNEVALLSNKGLI